MEPLDSNSNLQHISGRVTRNICKDYRRPVMKLGTFWKNQPVCLPESGLLFSYLLQKKKKKKAALRHYYCDSAVDSRNNSGIYRCQQNHPTTYKSINKTLSTQGVSKICSITKKCFPDFEISHTKNVFLPKYHSKISDFTSSFYSLDNTSNE